MLGRCGHPVQPVAKGSGYGVTVAGHLHCGSKLAPQEGVMGPADPLAVGQYAAPCLRCLR